MFVNNLAGKAPGLRLDATQAPGAVGYTYHVNLDLILYHDLVIEGDGNANFSIGGVMHSFDPVSGVTKRGTSTVTLTGHNTFTGPAVVEGGRVIVNGANAAIDGAEEVRVQAGARLTLQNGLIRTDRFDASQGTFDFLGGTLQAHWWCPSRRPQNVYSKGTDVYYALNAARATDGNIVAGRTDYAICVGDRNVVETGDFPGNGGGATPANYDMAKSYKWLTDTVGVRTSNGVSDYTGVSFQRSEIGFKEITDGSSQTYLIGEKYLDPEDYENGKDPGDNETWGTGFNNDVFRAAFDPPAPDRAGLPARDCQARIFGAAHTGWFMAWCDGHVEMLSFDIDLLVHRGNANRADEGRPLPITAPTAPTCRNGAL